MARKPLTAPFPYFGAKRKAADLIWARIGADVPNYVEPFCGSCAVLLARPGFSGKLETVNDIDGLLVNFWRAVKSAPEKVASYASWPVSELDLIARHEWLIGKRARITENLLADPDWFDAKAAGWWCWGMNAWVASGFGYRASSQKASNADERSSSGRLPKLSALTGVLRRPPHGVDADDFVHNLITALSNRLRHTRITAGDWHRVLSTAATTNHGLTAVVLDPPYDAENHSRNMYVQYGTVAKDVGAWCRENGGNPLLRIALCGYEGEHDLPGWTCVPWKGNNTLGPGKNGLRERIWFSPHCLSVGLFDSEFE